MNEPVHRWSTSTKRTVILIILVLLALVIYRFRDVLPPLVIALLLAFILDPIADFFTDHLHLSRGLATGLIFLVLLVGMLGVIAAPMTVVPAIQRAVISLQVDTTAVITEIGTFLERPVQVGEYTLDLSSTYEELSSILRSFVSSVAQGTLDIVLNLASGAFWLVIILMITFYLVKDADRFTEQLDNLAPPGYRDDFVRLRRQITDVWNAFLRGQLLLGGAMIVITTVVCTAVGLPYAGVMGLIAGVMEFVPNVGPIIALIPAALVALFQGSSFLPMSNFWFAMLVIGLYIVIQQIEGNLLVPRIMGRSLNLHPLVVLIGIIVGGNLAGILGMLLAAPVLATLRVVGHYVFCRLYDHDPFVEPEKATPKPKLLKRAQQAAWDRIQEEMKQRKIVLPPVHVRPAQPTDRPAVEAISAQIWEGHDYIPDVWGNWLTDSHGQFFVAELGGRVVGFAKLTRLADDEWWMEGLRVDPAHRGKGIAGQLQTIQVETARRTGRGTLRLGTHAENYPIHHIAVRDGFCRVAVYHPYRADPLPDDETPALHCLTETDLAAAWALTAESPRYQAASGLYEDFCKWKNLTREQLERHLAAGDIWGLDAEGKLAAWALICREGKEEEEKDKLHVGYVDGKENAISITLRELRKLAAQQGYTEVRFRPVDEPGLMAAAEAAGYEQRENSHDIWIFELQLEQGT
ncbi:MAG: hypothetical protein DRI77_05780 [Chloroflexi bacterium]|nr:MAG: hypothetical protein DRI77_05780 [Chloroflexota bacterium]